jgi:periplasmic protein TonB
MKAILFMLCIGFPLTGFSQVVIAPAPQQQNPDSTIFTYVEEQPVFPGGESAFMKFLADSIRYPKEAKENGQQGTVYVRFVVERDGSISNIEVVKAVPGAPALSQEALRVFSLMPKWTPGKMNGRPVRTEVIQPVKFMLTGDVPKRKDSKSK